MEEDEVSEQPIALPFRNLELVVGSPPSSKAKHAANAAAGAAKSPASSGPAGRRQSVHRPRAANKDGHDDDDEDETDPLTRRVWIEPSVSELTMRSSYTTDQNQHYRYRNSRSSSRGGGGGGERDRRRMAYYAVGKEQNSQQQQNGNKGGGGGGNNRKCYFTGREVPYGELYYAGCVRQGLKTLVVFCSPSAAWGVLLPKSVSPDGDEDACYGECRGAPSNPDQSLLDALSSRFPSQFDTLPAQVRNPDRWGLYCKFCFFSGLPVAGDEMHYRLKDEVARSMLLLQAAEEDEHEDNDEQKEKEVVLSHEVMEAAHGGNGGDVVNPSTADEDGAKQRQASRNPAAVMGSASLVRLPTRRAFRYLKRHYAQQCGKLEEEAFVRCNWERIMPEV